MDWNSGICKSPKKMAEDLIKIYDKKFGGKEMGRFRTSRKNFRKLSGLPNLAEDYIHEVSMWMRKKGKILVDVDKAFLVIPIKSTVNYRRVPDAIIKKILEGNDDDKEKSTDH